MEEYLSILQPAKTELNIKRSRFIGLVASAEQEERVKEILAEVRNSWPRATHYCYAAVLREPVLVERFSDDGEPSGTAGKPMLAVLRGAKLFNVVAVVIRYFGGTLLGTGGLARAYADTVQATIKQAKILRMVPCVQLQVQMEYSHYNQFMNKLFPAVIGEAQQVFSQEVSLQINVPQKDAADFTQKLQEICAAEYQVLGESYVPVEK